METAVNRFSMGHIKEAELKTFAKDVVALLNVSGVATGRATHYNTKQEQAEAEMKLHYNVFAKDRGVYGAIHCLPGVTDFAMQKATTVLLGNPWTKQGNSALTPVQELKILDRLTDALPPNRVLNTFVNLKELRVNNNRTKMRVMLPYILGSKSLDWWSVKYKRKIVAVLQHAWGLNYTGVLKQIVLTADQPATPAEIELVDKLISPYRGANSLSYVMECLRFLFDSRGLSNKTWGSKLFAAYFEAKRDIRKGAKLPKEVLEGIRSTYHPEIPSGEVLRLLETGGALTNKQRRLVQKQANKAGVVVEFNPLTANLVDLYIYAYEMGMSEDVRAAIKVKAKRAAAAIPSSFNRMGILVDDSFSMSGDKTQALRPIATSLALKDVLSQLGQEVFVKTASGRNIRSGLLQPTGGTDLGTGLVQLLKKGVDIVFIISDGYENQPAGRVAEIMSIIKNMHPSKQIPVHQLTPTTAAEIKKGVRSLSDDITTMAVSNPMAMGTQLLLSSIEADPLQGITGILNTAVQLLEGGK